MPLAFAGRIEPGQSLRPVYRRIARRVALLWCFGVVFQYFKQLGDGDPVSLELYSNTLQAIAVGYLVTSLALLHLRCAVRWRCWLRWLSVIGRCWSSCPSRDTGPVRWSRRRTSLGTSMWPCWAALRRDHHFTWVVSSLGFSASVLLGAMAGQLLRARLSVPRRLLYLVLVGLFCLAGGWAWSYSHPFNRHLWTSSMMLWAGGWSFLLLALLPPVDGRCQSARVGPIRSW